MADEENIQHPTDSIKRKRSRHWDLEETKKIVNKWDEDNMKERLRKLRGKTDTLSNFMMIFLVSSVFARLIWVFSKFVTVFTNCVYY